MLCNYCIIRLTSRFTRGRTCHSQRRCLWYVQINTSFNEPLVLLALLIYVVFLFHQATAEANNLAAVAAAKDQYYKNMEKVGSLICDC